MHTILNIPDLSIIIVNYRTPDLTIRCVNSIYKCAPQCTFEVIVVDNGSSDDLEEMLAERFPAVRFLETGRNTGFSMANNLGIQNSHGQFVILMNSDACFLKASLDGMLACMQANPRIGVLGPRHVDTNGAYQLSCGGFPTLFAEAVRKVIQQRLSADDYRVRDYLDAKYAQNANVDWVSGSCMMIRREALKDVRLLDERFFMYYEDIDFCIRSRDAGWKIHFLNDFVILHEGGGSARQNILRAMVENKRSQLYFSRKHYGFAAEQLLRFLLFSKYAFYFLKWGGIYLLKIFLRQKKRNAYTMALLAKKTVLESLKRAQAEPWTPRLVRSRERKPETAAEAGEIAAAVPEAV